MFASCQRIQIGAVEPELAAVYCKVCSLLQCVAVLGDACQCVAVCDNGEDNVCRILLIIDCCGLCCLRIRYSHSAVMIQTDVIEVPYAGTRIAVLSGIDREFLHTAQRRCFCGSSPLLYMEIGERDLDFCPALICSYLLDALPVSACAVYELECSFTVAAVRQDPETDAVKSGPVCAAQFLGCTAVSRAAVCNAVRIFQCSLAVFHVFLIQCQGKCITIGIGGICCGNSLAVGIAFKIIDHAAGLFLCGRIINPDQCRRLCALCCQHSYLMIAQFQLFQHIRCNGD